MAPNKFAWPLINDSITRSDKKALVEFINTPNVRFTNGEKVKKFEKEWSKWLGVKHTVFVNSGASANYIMASILKEKHGVGEVIVPPIGWVSDIAPFVNLGFKPVFVDVDLANLAMTAQNIRSAITKDTVGIVLVHALGFNGLCEDIINTARTNKIALLEDCCESHGALYNNQRVGNTGLMSNFSFYFGHHITTIEGGVVCTNDDEIYDLIKLYRSHGMTREASQGLQKKYREKYPHLNPLFTFAVPGYNMRNTEFNAVLGLEQMKRLDYNIDARKSNLALWLSSLDSKKYFVDYNSLGNSNFALPLILKNKDSGLLKRVETLLEAETVEYRIGTAGGGNQAKQPYLEKYEYRIEGSLENTNHIHNFGLYVGNHPELSSEQIINLCEKLNDC